MVNKVNLGCIDTGTMYVSTSTSMCCLICISWAMTTSKMKIHEAYKLWSIARLKKDIFRLKYIHFFKKTNVHPLSCATSISRKTMLQSKYTNLQLNSRCSILQFSRHSKAPLQISYIFWWNGFGFWHRGEREIKLGRKSWMRKWWRIWKTERGEKLKLEGFKRKCSNFR
jgi:hypothetical protein